MQENNDQYQSILKERLGRVFLDFLIPVSVIISVVSILFSLYPEVYPSRIAISIVVLLILIWGWYFFRNDRVYLGAILVTSISTLVLCVAVVFNGGVNAPAFVGLMAPMVIFAWISPPRVTIIYLIVYLCFGLTVVMLANHNLIPTPPHPSRFFYFVIYGAYAAIIGVVVLLGNKMMSNAFRDNLESEELLSGIFSSLSDSVVVLNESLITIKQNDSARDFLEKLKGKLKLDLLIELKILDQHNRQWVLGDIARKKDWFFEGETFKVIDCSPRLWLQISVTPLILNATQKGVILVIRDVTEKVEQEQQLQQVQKMDAVGQLASGIAHDFNNMLGAITGATEVLEGNIASGDSEMLNIIKESSKRAAGLTRELLLFSRKSSTELKSISLHKTIEKTIQMLKRILNRGINIHSNCNAEWDVVKGDESLIQSAIINMAINSSHAMGDKAGDLAIKTSIVRLEKEFCENSGFEIEPGDFIELEMSDNGCGMSEEVRSRIFEPFFSTKSVGEGTGLGMAAVYGMVKKHKGAIHVYSEEGNGSSFRIWFPVRKNKPYASRDIQVQFISGSGKILLVDDEEFIQKTATSMLKSLGYSIKIASNGKEALEHLFNEDFDLVLLDMIMPEVNGREVFLTMKKRQIKAPVIISSGFSKEEDLKLLANYGNVWFLRKPYQKLELSQVVHKAISSFKANP